MPKTILIHHHIFKNAGTSFNCALQQHFGKKFSEFDLPDSQIVTAADLNQFIQSHPQILAISSHHACMSTPHTDDYQTISSVILRNPLARVRSIYLFEKQQNAQTSGAIKAKELNFKKYVLWRIENTPIMFGNYQTHYCSRTQKTDLNKIPTETDLHTAIHNLNLAAVVGTVEHYQEFLSLAQTVLTQYYPKINLKYSRLNTTSHLISSPAEIRASLVDNLGQAIVSKLENMNQLDYLLYQKAETIMNQNLAKQVA